MVDLNKYKNKIIAHRGIHNNKDIPENSLKAFKEALKKNYPIELDIHLTKDNQLVVSHDDNIKRMTQEDKIIEKLTLKELKQYNLLNTKEKIPTLKEVFKLINGKVLIDIEVKAKKRTKQIVKKLLSELEDYTGEIIIKSFNPLVIREIKRKTSKYSAGLLLSYTTDDKKYNFIAKRKFFIPYSKPDFLAIDKKLLNNKYIKKQLTKYPILIWTIKTDDEITKINNQNFIFVSNNLPFNEDK